MSKLIQRAAVSEWTSVQNFQTRFLDKLSTGQQNGRYFVTSMSTPGQVLDRQCGLPETGVCDHACEEESLTEHRIVVNIPPVTPWHLKQEP